jgi:hypothetical protein
VVDTKNLTNNAETRRGPGARDQMMCGNNMAGRADYPSVAVNRGQLVEHAGESSSSTKRAAPRDACCSAAATENLLVRDASNGSRDLPIVNHPAAPAPDDSELLIGTERKEAVCTGANCPKQLFSQTTDTPPPYETPLCVFLTPRSGRRDNKIISVGISQVTGGWHVVATLSGVSRDAYCKDLKTVPQRVKELCAQLLGLVTP